jgi:hypothetical protein
MAKQNKKRAGQKSSGDSVLRKGRRKATMVFARRNYVILLMAVAAILLGYIVMRMDNQVEGFLSLYVAPIIVLGGYLGVIYAILWKEPEANNAD